MGSFEITEPLVVGHESAGCVFKLSLATVTLQEHVAEIESIQQSLWLCVSQRGGSSRFCCDQFEGGRQSSLRTWNPMLEPQDVKARCC